jgi:hypothetical protein
MRLYQNTMNGINSSIALVVAGDVLSYRLKMSGEASYTVCVILNKVRGLFQEIKGFDIWKMKKSYN